MCYKAQLAFQLYVLQKNILKARIFPNKHYDIIFVKIGPPSVKVIAKIQRGPDFREHGVVK